MSAPSEPLLFVWDGECGFCRFWVLRWKARVGGAAEVAPYQEVGHRVPEMDQADFRRSAKLVEADGTVREAAEAVFRLLSLAPGPSVGSVGWWLYRHLAPFRWISEAVYRIAARNRSLFGRLTRLFWGREPPPHGFRATGWILVRALALVYLTAFLSLAVQLRGLIGAEGILPVGPYLDAVAGSTGGGPAAWLRAPTLAWLAPGDLGLSLICGLGVIASSALFAGVLPLLSAGLAWVAYLSFVSAGQVFLSFQWDLLLLEAGFLLLFFVPAGSAAADDGPGPGPAGRFFRAPARWFPAVWLFWWLLFRLILESGLVKLASGDPVWRDLTALAHHYETQPLPNVVAWFAHRLPAWAHRLSTLGTFVVELAVPLLFFLPRRPRILGALAVIGHQLLILATGNYTFFNLLTIALALSLLDDGAWRRLLTRIPGGAPLLETLGVGGDPLPGRLRAIGAGGSADGEEPGEGRGREGDGGAGPVPGLVRRAAAGAFLAVAVAVGSVQLLGSGGVSVSVGPIDAARRALGPFGVVNGYGLFADMTTRRPEIVLQGRASGGSWRTLDFRYKPDDPAERPRQVAPHQPRLDWQMWFAALRAERAPPDAPPRVRYDRWLLRFVERLLAGEPRVWALLSPDGPFRTDDGVRPPDHVRALLYDYRFTTPEERGRSGRWWSRELLGTYLPPVRRTEGGLQTLGDGR